MYERLSTQLFVLSTAALFVLSCAEEDRGQSWQFDEPPPQSTVNQQLCQDMPGAQLDTPQVSEVGDGEWRIRYPVFERGCGVRQLDAVVRFADDGTAQASYTTAVCNRCDQPQQLNALDDFTGWMTANPPGERLAIPEAPRVTTVPTLLAQGRPVLRLSGDSVGPDACPGVWLHRSETTSYPSYSSLWRVTLEPGEQSEKMEGGGDMEPVFRLASGAALDELRIYWPRMYHRDVHVTGLRAASEPEFCETPVYAGDSIYARPYAEPYRLNAKYVRQTTSVPELPTAFTERLRTAGDGGQD